MQKLLPTPLLSPGDQKGHMDDPEVPAPWFFVHFCLVALSSSPWSHPGPDHGLEPIPVKSELGSPLGCGAATKPTTLIHCDMPWTLPSALSSQSLPLWLHEQSF